MTAEEAITALGDRNNLLWGMSKEEQKYYSEALDMAISALSENKGDLISRKSLLNKINAYVVGSQDKEFICKLIKEMPSVENKGEWIPVSERLPEMGVRVLCACQADIYDVLKLTPNGWLYDTRHTYMLGFVKAWQPLPEPYKAEKGGE